MPHLLLILLLAWSSLEDCPVVLQDALDITAALQKQFWSGDHYLDGETWTDANTFEDLTNLMLYTRSPTWDYINRNSHLAKLGAANAGHWDDFFQGSYDDAQWVILYYYKVSDYLNFLGQDDSSFVGSAGAIYDYVSAQWDDVCGGGLWWSGAHDYKNAIVNELFILTSASGFLRTGNQTYLQNAKKTADWLLRTGMRNPEGLFNDGLVTATCKNNGQTTWTYNQGVIASGLGFLGRALNDSRYWEEAEVTLDAVAEKLTVNGILKESCDDQRPGGGSCDHDQQIFKGVFVKHLGYYLDATGGDPGRVGKYERFLGAQQSAVYHYGKREDDLVGNVWYAPDKGGSVFTPETTASGIAATFAALKYGPCQPNSFK
eukprot:TRINITY_DN3869_c0_g1_i1.p1 TRINITY_DN3869_c0_g1~~TRINITY_DN3869_c0_g1_i1.p1  ORF type:complete len:374 (-),score=63.08 TRINITY_DN3869_c0_g1_i1:11-1132(-)